MYTTVAKAYFQISQLNVLLVHQRMVCLTVQVFWGFQLQPPDLLRFGLRWVLIAAVQTNLPAWLETTTTD